jgi:mRNA-capping enzyme
VGTGGMKRGHDNNGFEQSNKRMREETRNLNPQFAVSLPGVTAVCLQSAMTAIQLKCQRMCEWNRRGFPGSQPVSMDITNYMTIVQSPYMVSWKADGTRYLMLIEEKHKIYMFDRDNNVFEISHLEFPKDGDYTSHLTNTLVDGELVIDNVNGIKTPRYLIYDIVVYENENVGRKPFKERLDLIRRSIVGVRNEAISKNLIDRNLDPFSVRNKDFWDLSTVHKLLGSEFRSGLAHEMDGLIFQPKLDPYTPGRSPRVLKWKEDNTIDFLLKISVDNSKIGQLPEKKACLFVNGMKTPFSTMRYTSELRQYDNKIIECSYHNNQWHFHRHRTDKSFPNAKETAFGAIRALKDPITAEVLCSLIDKHLKQNMH